MRSAAERISDLIYFWFLSFIATLIAALTGTFIVALSTGSAGAVAILPWGLFMGSKFAAPVTCGLFPLTALFLAGRKAATFGFPLVGLLGGAVTMWLWMEGRIDGMAGPVFVAAGMMGGLASGVFYGRALREFA